ncbi:MAG: anaerobic ribonucleoside-triphosphate reductase, partial [Lachnospiraceae bacterium]|nr:anaerobic ribonucleoside-triphosphate reductase [Lachnospiraceae bacterium]
MNIIKRNGEEVEFNGDKIVAAVKKANKEVAEHDKLSDEQINTLESHVEKRCEEMSRAMNVEEIQDLVEDEIMNFGKFDLARKYITYRYKRELVRKSNTTDDKILSLISFKNEDVKQENSNKNPVLASTQRDYMA